MTENIHSFGRVIILFLLHKADKSAIFNHLYHTSFALCSKQQLLQPHLTIRENLQFISTLYGLPNSPRIDDLLTWSEIGEQAAKTPVHDLPHAHIRLINLLVSLLSSAPLLVVDDFADGLSQPAKRQLWQQLMTIPAPAPPHILYLTTDMEILQAVKTDEVWWWDGKKACQLEGNMWQTGSLVQPKSYVFEFDTARYAKRFHEKITNHPEQLGLQQSNLTNFSPSIQVTINTAQFLIDLMLAAGTHLVRVQTLPHPTTFSSIQFDGQTVFLDQLLPIQTQQIFPKLSGKYKLKALWHIAKCEWQRHFRGFWKAGNLVLSHLLPFGLLALLLQNIGQFPTTDWLLLTAATLISSAGVWLCWGVEALNRVMVMADFSSQPNPDRPFSLLALLDTTRISRFDLLAGLLWGQFVIIVSHAIPFLLFGATIFTQFYFLLGCLIFWLFIVLGTLPLGILLGYLTQKPNWSFVVGGAAYLSLLFISLALQLLPESWQMLTWPLTGFMVSFQKLFVFQTFSFTVFPPFLITLGTMLLLWWVAIRFFLQRSSIWWKPL